MKYNFRMTADEFSKVFFEVSDILSSERKKMKYQDWIEIRKIAIGSTSCNHDDHKTLRIFIPLNKDSMSIMCDDCGKMFKYLDHEETIIEMSKALENREILQQLKEEKENLKKEKKEINGIINYVDNMTKKEYNNNIIKNNENKEENETMMNTNKMFKGLDFGKANKDLYRLSHLGLAIKNAEGTFVSYDSENKELVDVDLFDFDLDGMIYKMPVAHNQVVVGDIIVHNGKSMLVQELKGNNLEVVDPAAGEIKTIMPTKNMFGFNFFTKILCLMDMNNLGASTDSPFGNMMPFMMMSAMKDGDGGNNDMMTMMMMSQIMGGNNSMGDMFSNPMMMMAMMSGDGKMGDMLPMMMMSGMFNQQPQVKKDVTNIPAHSGCGGNCTCNNSTDL